MSDSYRPVRRGCLSPLGFLAFVALGLVGFWFGDQNGYERGYGYGFAEGYGELAAERMLKREPGVDVGLKSDPEAMLEVVQDLSSTAMPEAFAIEMADLYGEMALQVAYAYGLPSQATARMGQGLLGGQEERLARQWAFLRRAHERRHPMPDTVLALEQVPRAQDLQAVLRDEACHAMQEAATLSADAERGPPILLGLCSLVDRELVGPYAERLMKLALARDIDRAVTDAQVTSKETIFDLATSEMRIDAVVRHDYESTLFKGWPIETKDVASLEVRGQGIVKTGFAMSESYSVEVQHEEERILVTLPPPAILSITMVPEFATERQGWWTSLNTAQRNQALKALQDRVEAQALKDGALDDAQTRARTVVSGLYLPFTTLPGSAWEVDVRFTDAPTE
ncbi:MAG: DUF4230 domain-containing protein [Myxococcota bacterium]